MPPQIHHALVEVLTAMDFEPEVRQGDLFATRDDRAPHAVQASFATVEFGDAVHQLTTLRVFLGPLREDWDTADVPARVLRANEPMIYGHVGILETQLGWALAIEHTLIGAPSSDHLREVLNNLFVHWIRAQDAFAGALGGG